MTITINNKSYKFKQGETILDVAKRNNIKIPTLCFCKKKSGLYSDGHIISAGKCRICVVESILINKNNRNFNNVYSNGENSVLITACNTPAKDRMQILTKSHRVTSARKTVVDLILSSGNHNCLGCEKTGECKLQEIAYDLGIEAPGFTINIVENAIDDSSEFIKLDRNRCINCGICVEACKEIVCNNVIELSNRGLQTKIIFDNENSLGNSSCVQCGECSQLCPTGALTDKKSRGKGLSWKIKKIKTICPYCGVGCGLIIYVNKDDNKIVKISGDESNNVNKGSLCVKGRYGFDFILHPERLTKPLKKLPDGSFEPISWYQAISEICTKFLSLENGEFAGFSSAKMTNEENYLFQKLFRKYFHNNNIDHCARLCHSSTVSGLSQTLGSGAMTNNIDDIFNAKLIFVIGSDTTETHPVIGYFIKQAVRFNNCKLVVADPKKTNLAKFADIYAPIIPGFDTAFINSIIHCIICKKELDADIINRIGFNEFINEIKKDDYMPEKVSKYCGVESDFIKEIADLFIKINPAKVIFAMGVTQHSNGTDNVISLSNLQLLCGNIGVKGGGINPLRGQANVQGACDMGCLPNTLPGYQSLDNDLVIKKFNTEWNCSLNKIPGITMTEAFEKAYQKKMKAFYICGENPVVSEPNRNHTIQALNNLDLLVVQDIFFTETAEYADYVLPATSFAEKEGHFTNTERLVQKINPAIKAIGSRHNYLSQSFNINKLKLLKANPLADSDIYQLMMLFLDNNYKFMKIEEVTDEINRLVPQYAGITFRRTKNKGIHWPCTNSKHNGTPILFLNESLNNTKFVTTQACKPMELPDKDYPYILTTGRILSQFHSRTMTGKTQGLNNIGKAFVMISPYDAEQLSIDSNSIVKVLSRRGEIEIPVKISKRIRQGVVFIPFHFNENPANVLTNNVYDSVSKIPELKACAVNILPCHLKS